MTESQIRRKLRELGLALQKDRARRISSNHLGGYNVIVLSVNGVIHGGNYGWTLDQIVEYFELDK